LDFYQNDHSEMEYHAISESIRYICHDLQNMQVHNNPNKKLTQPLSHDSFPSHKVHAGPGGGGCGCGCGCGGGGGGGGKKLLIAL
jgi:uncharacterized membrane protein